MTNTYILSFLLSFTVSFLLTSPIQKLAIRYGFSDSPSRQHPGVIHSTLISRAGGVAIFISFIIVSLFFTNQDQLLYGILAGSFINVAIGTLDDKWDISPPIRLLFQFISALIIVLSGISFYVTNPLGEGIWYFNQTQYGVFTLPADIILIFWIMFMMNTTNWTKGASQLPGISVIAFLALAGVAFRYQAGNPYQMQTILLSLICAGSVLAFLPFNFPPEKMFPGFGASTFIGFNLAVLSVLSGGKIATILIVFAIPIIDALLVGAKRILTGHNPLVHDREHIYHFLLDVGWKKKQIIYFYWITALLFGITAVFLESSGKIIVIASLTIAISITFVWLYLKKSKRLNGNTNDS